MEAACSVESAAAPDEDHQPRSWQRFYMGYHERFVDDCVLELQGGKIEVRVAQAPSARVSQKRRGASALDKAADPALTGTTVWDGAVVLSQLLADTNVLEEHTQQWTQPELEAEGQQQQQQQIEEPGASADGSTNVLPSLQLQPSLPQQQQQQQLQRLTNSSSGQQIRCIELGAGTGAVSLSLLATRKVSRCEITDLPDLLPHLQLNLDKNSRVIPRKAAAHIAALRWGPDGAADIESLELINGGQQPYHLIVGADLIYYTYCEATPHSRLLLWTLRRLVTPGVTVVYLALSLHHNPEEVERFLGTVVDAGFTVERLSADIPPRWRVPDVLVARIHLPATP